MTNKSREFLKLHEREFVEQPFLQQLEGLGWQTIYLTMGHSQQAADSYRSDFNQVLLLPILYEALEKINPWLDDTQLDECVRHLTAGFSGKSLLENNQTVLNRLLEHIHVAKNHQTNESNPTVKLLDFDNPENNSFIAISQLKLRISGTEKHIYPDIVLFVNGLPLVVVECKSPNVKEPIPEAIDQLLRYSEQRGAKGEGCPALFFYNQFLIVTCRTEAKFGTITTHTEKHFYRWSDPYPLDINQLKQGTSAPNDQQRLVAGMLAKQNLLDIIRSFTLFATNDKGLIKVVGRYQQFRAVKEATKRLLKGNNPFDRSGIIWHTQGSGKSLTMMFMVREMYRHPKLMQWKIVFVTDRTQLEEQLAETSQHIGFTVKVADSVKSLKALLASDSSDLVMAMIHKFQESDLDTLFPELNTSPHILVMTDEAHRSQYSKLAANLDKAIPNASRIGYTGTPIDKTEKLFGAYIDKYTMKQAIKDGVTLEIVYEGRTHNAEIKDGNKMDKEFADVFSDYNLTERLQILGYGSREAYLEAESTIKAKAEDMIKHYLTHIFSAGFKAQVVATSREAAVRYKTHLDNAIKAELEELEKDNPNGLNLERLKKLQTAVVISGNHNDKVHIKEHTNSNTHKAIIKSFKMPFDSEEQGVNGNIGIIIVNNMLLTGFDAPIEQVLYLDKVIVAHNLLQTIARVNRVGSANKDKGFVVDYVGIGYHLKKALDVYDKKEQKEITDCISSLDDELRTLDSYFKDIKALFNQNKVTDWEDYDAFYDLFSDEDIRFQYIMLFKNVTRALNNLYPAKEALNYLKDYQNLVCINVMAERHFRDKRLSMKGIPDKLRAITDKYLSSKGIDLKVEPISILSAEFENQNKKRKRTKTKAAEIEHAIRHHLEVNIDDTDSASFTEELERILKDYAGNWDKIYQELEKLRQKIKNAGQEPTYGLHRKKQLPFFKLFKKQFFQESALNDDQISILVDLTQQVFNAIERELKLVDFWGNTPAQNQLRGELQTILLTERFINNLPDIFKDRKKIVSDIMQLALKNSDIIV